MEFRLWWMLLWLSKPVIPCTGSPAGRTGIDGACAHAKRGLCSGTATLAPELDHEYSNALGLLQFDHRRIEHSAGISEQFGADNHPEFDATSSGFSSAGGAADFDAKLHPASSSTFDLAESGSSFAIGQPTAIISRDFADWPSIPESAGRTATERGRRCPDAGARIWLTAIGASEIGKHLTPRLVEEILAATVSPQSGNDFGFTWRLENIKIQSLTLRPLRVGLVSGKGFAMDMQVAESRVSADWFLDGSDWWNPVSASGQVSGALSNDTLAASTLSPFLSSPEGGLVKLALKLAKLRMPVRDVQINGSYIAPFLQVVYRLFSNKLETALEDSLGWAMEQFVGTDLSDMLLRSQVGFMQQFSWLGNSSGRTSADAAVDVQFCNVATTAQAMELDVRAVFNGDGAQTRKIGTNTLDKNSTLSKALPSHPPEGIIPSMVVASISDVVLSSAMALMENTGSLKFIFKHSHQLSAVNASRRLLDLLVPPWWRRRRHFFCSRPQLKEVRAAAIAPRFSFVEGSIGFSATIRIGLTISATGFSATSFQRTLAVELPVSAVSAAVTVEQQGETAPQLVRTKLLSLAATPASIPGSRTRPPPALSAANALTKLVIDNVVLPAVNDRLQNGFNFTFDFAGARPCNTSIKVGTGELSILTNFML